jgi:DSF synthase
MNSYFVDIFRKRKEITVRYDPPTQALWYYFNPSIRPCFSPTMLMELRELVHDVTAYFNSIDSKSEPLIRYFVLSSQIPGIFNLGGDVALFAKLIRQGNRQRLYEYARLCVELCYLNAVNLNLPLTSVSVVEGTAMGGGLESALAANIFLATENAEMGFPEIRFNLFPGMSAYSFLARLCGIVTAEKMIASGATYTAREMYKMGIVHRVISSDNIKENVDKYLRQHQRSGNGLRAIQLARQRYHPVDYQELEDITKIWVNAAFSLEERDLRMMDRLVRAQTIKLTNQKKESFLRTKQDRRFSPGELSFPIKDWSGNIIMKDRRTDYDRRQDFDEPLVCNE